MRSWTYGALRPAPHTELRSKQSTKAGTEELVRKRCTVLKIHCISQVAMYMHARTFINLSLYYPTNVYNIKNVELLKH